MHKRSFEKSTHCNNFAYMELTIAEENDTHVYENNSVQETNRVDLDSDGDESIGFMDTDSNTNKKLLENENLEMVIVLRIIIERSSNKN